MANISGRKGRREGWRSFPRPFRFEMEAIAASLGIWLKWPVGASERFEITPLFLHLFFLPTGHFISNLNRAIYEFTA